MEFYTDENGTMRSGTGHRRLDRGLVDLVHPLQIPPERNSGELRRCSGDGGGARGCGIRGGDEGTARGRGGGAGEGGRLRFACVHRSAGGGNGLPAT